MQVSGAEVLVLPVDGWIDGWMDRRRSRRQQHNSDTSSWGSLKRLDEGQD